VRDVDQNGSMEIVAGAGPRGAPHVRAFQIHGGGEVASFFAFGESLMLYKSRRAHATCRPPGPTL
jgi:hypothetical protein